MIEHLISVRHGDSSSVTEKPTGEGEKQTLALRRSITTILQDIQDPDGTVYLDRVVTSGALRANLFWRAIYELESLSARSVEFESYLWSANDKPPETWVFSGSVRDLFPLAGMLNRHGGTYGEKTSLLFISHSRVAEEISRVFCTLSGIEVPKMGFGYGEGIYINREQKITIPLPTA